MDGKEDKRMKKMLVARSMSAPFQIGLFKYTGLVIGQGISLLLLNVKDYNSETYFAWQP